MFCKENRQTPKTWRFSFVFLFPAGFHFILPGILVVLSKILSRDNDRIYQ